MTRARALATTLLLLLAVVAGAPAAGAASWEQRVPNAIWSWWGHDQSVVDVDGTWTGTVARRGTVRLHHLGDDGTVTEVRLGTVRPDDHTTPGLALDREQPELLAFWTGHGRTSSVMLRRVDRASRTAGPVVELPMPGRTTYTQVVSYGERVVLVTRASGYWVYTVSEDWGRSWDTPRRLFDNVTLSTRVYVVLKQHPTVPGRAQLAVYGHPTIATPYRYTDYAEVDLRTGVVASSFVASPPDPGTGVIEATPEGHYGNLLDDESGPALLPGTLPHAISPSGDHRVRLLDVGVMAGRPAMAYAVWRGATGPARYKVKVLGVDGVWRNDAVDVPTGVPFGYSPATKYLGGMVLAGDDSVVLSRERTGRWYLERHRTDGTWTRIGGGGRQPLARPYVPRGAPPGTFVVQKLLRYASFTDYDSDLLLYRSRTG